MLKNAKGVNANDTADAAKMIASSEGIRDAAIASEEAALHGVPDPLPLQRRRRDRQSTGCDRERAGGSSSRRPPSYRHTWTGVAR